METGTECRKGKRIVLQSGTIWSTIRMLFIQCRSMECKTIIFFKAVVELWVINTKSIQKMLIFY